MAARFMLSSPAEPTLEFNGSVRYVLKGHPTLVTYVDLIFQPQWKFRVLVVIGLNRLSGLQTLLFYIALIYSFLFFPKGFEDTWWR